MNGYTPFITVTGARAPGTFKIRYERIESMESTGNGTQVFLIGALDPLYLAETPDEVEALIVKADALEWDDQIENLANPPEPKTAVCTDHDNGYPIPPTAVEINNSSPGPQDKGSIPEEPSLTWGGLKERHNLVKEFPTIPEDIVVTTPEGPRRITFIEGGFSNEVQKASDELLETKGRFTFNHTPGSNPEMSRIRVEFRDITEHQKHADHILGSDNVYVNWEDMRVKPNVTVQKLLLELSIACNLMLKDLYMKGKPIDDQ